jgi:hypothetical protein
VSTCIASSSTSAVTDSMASAPSGFLSFTLSSRALVQTMKVTPGSSSGRSDRFMSLVPSSRSHFTLPLDVISQ